MIDRVLETIESFARYMKARRYGEIFLFVLSLVMLIGTLASSILYKTETSSLQFMDASILYFVLWLMWISIYAILIMVTLTVLVKRWGHVQLILIGLVIQGIGVLILCFNLPLR